MFGVETIIRTSQDSKVKGEKMYVIVMLGWTESKLNSILRICYMFYPKLCASIRTVLQLYFPSLHIHLENWIQARPDSLRIVQHVP